MRNLKTETKNVSSWYKFYNVRLAARNYSKYSQNISSLSSWSLSSGEGRCMRGSFRGGEDSREFEFE